MIHLTCDYCGQAVRLGGSKQGRIAPPDGWYMIYGHGYVLHFCGQECAIAYADTHWSEADCLAIAANIDDAEYGDVVVDLESASIREEQCNSNMIQ